MNGVKGCIVKEMLAVLAVQLIGEFPKIINPWVVKSVYIVEMIIWLTTHAYFYFL